MMKGASSHWIARLRLVFVAVFLGVGGAVCGARTQDAAIETTLRQAQVEYDTAANLLAGPAGAQAGEQARARFLRAAAGFRSVLESGYSTSAAVQYNFGNASLQAGDLGSAVLALRRVLALNPGHADARQCLDTARSRVGSPTAALRTTLSSRMLAIIGAVPRATRVMLFVVFQTIAAALILWKIIRAWNALSLQRESAGRASAGPTWRSIVCLFVLALLPLATVVAEEVRLSRSGDAVLLTSVQCRTGPDQEAYPALMEEPLRPGSEVRLIEYRANWAMIALPDGQHAWVPANAVEAVIR